MRGGRVQMKIELPPQIEWAVFIAPYIAAVFYVIYRIYDKVKVGNAAEHLKRANEIAGQTEFARLSREDAIAALATKTARLATTEGELEETRGELEECKKAGARMAHSYFELQGRQDEIERRVKNLEDTRSHS